MIDARFTGETTTLSGFDDLYMETYCFGCFACTGPSNYDYCCGDNADTYTDDERYCICYSGYYADTDGTCVNCDPSCTGGCTGPAASDCNPDSLDSFLSNYDVNPMLPFLTPTGGLICFREPLPINQCQAGLFGLAVSPLDADPSKWSLTYANCVRELALKWPYVIEITNKTMHLHSIRPVYHQRSTATVGAPLRSLRHRNRPTVESFSSFY